MLQEGGAPHPNALSIRLPSPLATNLVVDLSVTPAGEASFLNGSSVTIPAGSAEVLVGLEIPADSRLEGSREVTVTGTALGFVCTTATFQVVDGQIAVLSWRAPAEVFEGLDASGTLLISQPPDTDVRVQLASSDPGLISLPEFVTIPAGSSSVSVAMVAGEDVLLTRVRPVEITASVAGWPKASLIVMHRDDEPAY